MGINMAVGFSCMHTSCILYGIELGWSECAIYIGRFIVNWTELSLSTVIPPGGIVVVVGLSVRFSCGVKRPTTGGVRSGWSNICNISNIDPPSQQYFNVMWGVVILLDYRFHLRAVEFGGIKIEFYHIYHNCSSSGWYIIAVCVYIWVLSLMENDIKPNQTINQFNNDISVSFGSLLFRAFPESKMILN